jgi:serine/threonine-protein kinase
MQGTMDALERAAQARIGQVLRDKWRLERVLGVGGMATVYAATHRNGMRGAVKILHPEVARDPDARTRFLREGYVANRVDRGAVKVLDDDVTEDGTVFLVMELLEGETVDARALRCAGERLPAKEVVDLSIQLLETLERAHAAGIVHRDIKPENLFLTTTGELRVLDFGIARLREPTHGSVRATDTRSAMGTPAFMPPEQALARWDEVGPHSDLYAVGATMFNLLSGQLTHEARSAPELLVAVATKNARPLAQVMPTIAPALAAIVDRAVAHSPAHRWPDARSMRAELARIAPTVALLDDPTIEDPRGVPSARARTPMQLDSTPGGTLHSGAPAGGGEGTVVIPVLSAGSVADGVISAVAPTTRLAKVPTTAPVSSDRATDRVGGRSRVGAALVIGAVAICVVGLGTMGVYRWRAGASERTAGGDPSSEVAASTAPAEGSGAPPRPSAVATPNTPEVLPAPSAPASTSASSTAPAAGPSPSAASQKPGGKPRPAGSAPAAPTGKPSLDLSNPN